MKRPTLPKNWIHISALAAALSLCSLPHAQSQDAAPPPQGTSRGENFSAKPPAQLFATDCTGAGCHKGPQGLGKNAGIGLAGFLREHYTNSRESAAALANYLTKMPSAPEPRDARKPPAPGAKPATATAAPSALPSWGEGGDSKAQPHDTRASRQQPAGRTSRATVRPDDEPAAAPPAPPVAAPPVGEANPSARAQRGRQPGATAAAPPPPPEPEPAPPPPAPKQYDIFD
jgi:hypothetical protein